MKPVTLNLAPRPFRNNTVMGTILGVIGTALVLATAHNLYVFITYGSSYAELQRDQAEVQARIEKLQAQETHLAAEIRKRDFKKLYERGKFASDLIRQHSFSWTELFNVLESVVPPDVVMTAIRPTFSPDKIVLRVEGVAKNAGAFRALQDRLLANPLFSQVFPENERKMNPSLPDITFLLSCQYLPRRLPGADLVADNAAASGTAAAPAAGSEGPAAAPAKPESGTPAEPTPAPEKAPAAGSGGAKATATGTAPASDTKPAVSRRGGGAPAPKAGEVVGRDGRPRSGKASTPILAPGAVYARGFEPPPAGGAHGPAAPAAKKARRTASPKSSKTGTPAAPPARSPARGKDAGAKKETEAGAAKKTEHESPATPPSTSPPAPRTFEVSRTMRGPHPWDPNIPRTLPPAQKALRAAQPQPPKKPLPAQRLDLSLDFKAVPARTVYARLAEAHGARIDLDPGIDPEAPVTLDLQGKNLDEALALVAGLLHHRVLRQADGAYKVVARSTGRPIGEAPIHEEPLGGGSHP